MKFIQPTMNPLDVVILVKLALSQEPLPQVKLAQNLFISQSEVSKSLARSKYAGLMDSSGKKVMHKALLDFLQYGIRYSFPQQPGAVVRGIPTAHSAPPLSDHIQSDEPYVWPSASGEVRGHGIAPLYTSVIQAVKVDSKLHEALALIDALRVGRARERTLAFQLLSERL